MTWDDDTAPRFELEEPSFDRITAIPELPSEVYAKRMMGETPDWSGPLDGRADDADPVSGTFERGSDPPLLDVDDVAALRSTAPPPVRQPPPPAPPRIELDFSEFERNASQPPISDSGLRELKDRYAMGDYSGALIVAEGVLESDPGHAEALRFAKNCRDVLTQMYVARLGALEQVVNVGIPKEQIRWLSLDHRAGFLLSLVDGSLSIEEILDISGMPRLDALRIMFSLHEERVIALRPRER